MTTETQIPKISFEVPSCENYLNVPEEYRPREYGNNHVRPVRLGSLIVLSQIRGGCNPELDSLRRSIGDKDINLINNPIVGHIQSSLLEEYIDFVNNTWSSVFEFSDFEPDESGKYHLLMAGHSRFEAILLNATDDAKQAADAGYLTDPMDTIVHCQIREVDSPVDIVNLQVHENIHNQPSEARRVYALAETFSYGLKHRFWKNKSEFIQANRGKVKPVELDRAVAFQELPGHVRDLIMAGRYRFDIGVELAKLYHPRLEYIRQYWFGNKFGLEEDEVREIEEAVFGYMVELFDKSVIGKWSLKKAKQVVRGHLGSMKGSLAEKEGRSEDNLLFMTDPEADWEHHRRVQGLRMVETLGGISVAQVNMAQNVYQIALDFHRDNPDQFAKIRGVLAERLDQIESGLRGITG